MRIMTMNKEKLQEILDKHAKWLNHEVGGVRADLQGADLQYVNLQHSNLQYASLQHANLQDVNLQGANLQHANLQDVNLQGAKLQHTNLQDDNLHGADLSFADLQNANLQGANLSFADLQDANLQDASLQGADLSFANLQDANLQGADLQDANLQGALFNWVNWHEAENIKVYVAGLQSSRDNAQLTYIPSIDVATTGCWQGSWQATIERINSVYADGTRERKAYDLAIEYIENQMALDDVETDRNQQSKRRGD